MNSRRAFRVSGLFSLYLVFCGPVAAQNAPTPAEIERVNEVHAAVASVATALGDGLWPNFRPGEGPVLYTGLGGGVLMGWEGELPERFRPIDGLDGGAWSDRPDYPALMARHTTFTSLDSSYSLPGAVALAVHEHFHVHQRMAARAGRSFGRGEPPAAVRYYPVYDTANAVLTALEGRVLAEAIGGTEVTAPTRAREFLAVRARRRAHLPEEIGRWERLTERNEGLADYVAIRALAWMAERDFRGWGRLARMEREQRRTRLRELVELAETSLRRRFYATGSAQAILLDRLAPGWKDRMVAGDAAPEELLASSVGFRSERAEAIHEGVSARENLSALRERVGAFLSGLADRREAMVEGLLSAEGLRVVLEAGDRGEICGLDPLNVRHVPGDRVVHPAFVRVCSTDQSFTAQFNGTTVEELDRGAFTVVLGATEDLELRAAETALSFSDLEHGSRLERFSLSAPALSVEADRVWIGRGDGTLIVRPLSLGR